MPYTKQWGSTHPGCIIFMLDQSGSMQDGFGSLRMTSRMSKQQAVATLLNTALDDLVRTNTVGAVIKPRADIAVIGYGGSGVGTALLGNLAGKLIVSFQELKDNPLRIDTKMRDEMDETGNIVQVPVAIPVWVEPVASGGTPMVVAFHQAKVLAEDWATKHPNNFPPIIVHVTDGESTDGDPTPAAQELCHVETADGQALLFNCHISSEQAMPIEFPMASSQIPINQYAQMLYATSSLVPDRLRDTFNATGGSMEGGARGFIFNGDALSLKKMITFGTTAAAADR